MLDIKSARITAKCQISIPKSARTHAGFKKNSRVAILTYEDRVEIRPMEQLSKGLATALASEAALARDWNTPEEDEAWKDL